MDLQGEAVARGLWQNPSGSASSPSPLPTRSNGARDAVAFNLAVSPMKDVQFDPLGLGQTLRQAIHAKPRHGRTVQLPRRRKRREGVVGRSRFQEHGLCDPLQGGWRRGDRWKRKGTNRTRDEDRYGVGWVGRPRPRWQPCFKRGPCAQEQAPAQKPSTPRYGRFVHGFKGMIKQWPGSRLSQTPLRSPMHLGDTLKRRPNWYTVSPG